MSMSLPDLDFATGNLKAKCFSCTCIMPFLQYYA